MKTTMGTSSVNDSQEKQVTNVDHAPITTFSSTKSSFSYCDVPFKKRFKFVSECIKITKRPRFDSFQDEEDYYFDKVDQEFYQELREKYTQGLATEKATKICPHFSTKDHEKKNKKKKRKITKDQREPVVSNDVTKRLERFIESDDMINGSDLKLVIQRTLFKSDLKRDQNRLNIPINQLETQDFLTDDEKRVIEKGEIEVGLVGPTLQMYEKPMVFKKWRQKSTWNYVLRTNWNRFVEDHKDVLKKGAKIQLWSFRKDRKLCFAIACVDQNDVV